MAENPTLAFLQQALSQGASASVEEAALVNEFMRRLIISDMTIDTSGNITAPFITATPNVTNATGTLPVLHGGTGQTTASAAFDGLSPTTTRGDLIARGASSNGRLAVGSANTVLRTNGTDPSWGQAVLTTDVTGILPVANGGTNSAFFTPAGPTAARTYTFPDASTTILTTNAAVTPGQGGTGITSTPSNGQLLIGNGTNYTAATPSGSGLTAVGGSGTLALNVNSRLLDKSTTEQDVVNTVTETSVYAFSVPGGTLSTANILRFTMTGYVDLSGSSSTLTVRLKFGGTTIATASPIATAPSKTPIRLTAHINANGATNSQRAEIEWKSLADSGVTTDGTLATIGSHLITGESALAIDTTSAQTLTVTFQWSGAVATAHAKRWMAITELLS